MVKSTKKKPHEEPAQPEQDKLDSEPFDCIMSESDREVLPAFVYVRLHNALKRHRQTFTQNIDRADVAYVSWMARNIMELAVWVEYCSLSVEKAQEFYDDAIRDVLDIGRINANPNEGNWKMLNKFASTLPTFKEIHKYKNIGVAAKEAGFTNFSQDWKALSKFAHPTAMTVMAPMAGDELKLNLLEISKNSIDISLSKLNSSLLGEHYRKYKTSIERVNATRSPAERCELE